MSITQKCKIEGCEKQYIAKKMCSMHYQRVKRYSGNAYTSTRFDKRSALIDGEIAKIPLGIDAKDGYAIVDKDFSYLDKYKWSKNSMGYASANTGIKSENMHKLILNGVKYIDHINRDKLDNRVINLREATHSLNMANKYQCNKSGFKGVSYAYWIKSDRWVARISKNGKRYHIGTYKTPEEAASAYDKKAKELFGDFAGTNTMKGVI